VSLTKSCCHGGTMILFKLRSVSFGKITEANRDSVKFTSNPIMGIAMLMLFDIRFSPFNAGKLKFKYLKNLCRIFCMLIFLSTLIWFCSLPLINFVVDVSGVVTGILVVDVIRKHYLI